MTACRRFAKGRAQRRSALFGQGRANPDLVGFGLAESPDYDWSFGSVARGASTTSARKRIYREAMRACLAGRAGQF
jgi:hypothetical protein